MKFESNSIIFIQENTFEVVVCQNGDHFVHESTTRRHVIPGDSLCFGNGLKSSAQCNGTGKYGLCITDDIMKLVFLNWNFKDLIDNKSAFVQIMVWCRRETTNHYLNQWWLILLTQIYATRLQWVNSLRPSDAIWRHRSGPTLAQVMACCLTAPSHYLNQCWLIISKV